MNNDKILQSLIDSGHVIRKGEFLFSKDDVMLGFPEGFVEYGHIECGVVIQALFDEVIKRGYEIKISDVGITICINNGELACDIKYRTKEITRESWAAAYKKVMGIV